MLKSILLAAIAALNGGSFAVDFFPCPHNSGMVIVRDTTGMAVAHIHLPTTSAEVGSINIPVAGDVLTVRWTGEFVKIGVKSNPTNVPTAWARGLK